MTEEGRQGVCGGYTQGGGPLRAPTAFLLHCRPVMIPLGCVDDVVVQGEGRQHELRVQFGEI